MSQGTRIALKLYQDPGLFYRVLIFEKDKETLESLTHKVREKLGLNTPTSGIGDGYGMHWYNMLMLESGGVIDELSVIRDDDKIVILSIEQENRLAGLTNY
jgi:hypothetical protein